MSTPPVVDPPTRLAPGDERIVGVLLAAGRSDRFGAENKLLASVDGALIVRRALATLRESSLDEVVAVVGFEADRVTDALQPVECHHNDDWRAGMGTSVAVGARLAAAAGADAVLFALGDMPWVDAASVDALRAAYREGAGSALAAACEGRRGNPVLFDRTHFGALADLDGQDGGIDVFRACEQAVLVETRDSGVLRDIDRPTDL